ncbi:MAG: iron-containing alcohol dehydrogenase [Candidatus Magnetominusculus sp. LBB02]|nr:iron-containing alcohol dehydrogenase [Candidatus Magnetominusculus sp. LBB02]
MPGRQVKVVAPLSFNFARIPAVYFGAGVFNTLPKLLCRFGKTVLIVTGGASFKKTGRLDTLLGALRQEGIKCYGYQIPGEPSPEMVDDAVSGFGESGIEAVVGIGGGSVIDGAKAISAMLPTGGSVLNYLEGVGDPAAHSGVKIPFAAVPTTSGTGSEATKNAVLSRVGDDGFKKSLRHDNFVPDIALIDPDLTLTSPPEVAAACAMDALTQLLESYVSVKASPMTDSLAIGALALAIENMEASVSGDIQARAAMAYAAMISGMTLANAGLGVVHGLASSVGARFDIPHGVLCGTMVGAATRANLKAAGAEAVQKYAAVGALITGEQDINSALVALTDKLDGWIESLKIPRLSAFGIRREDLRQLAAATSNKESHVRLSKDEIEAALSERL